MHHKQRRHHCCALAWFCIARTPVCLAEQTDRRAEQRRAKRATDTVLMIHFTSQRLYVVSYFVCIYLFQVVYTSLYYAI